MRTRLPVLMLIAAVSLAGCGGSSKSSSSSSPATTTAASTETTAATTTSTATIAKGTGPPLSKSALASRANAICRQLNTYLNKPGANGSNITHIAAERGAAEQAALTKLSKLTPPASMAGDYEQMLKARQMVIEDLKKIGENATTGKTAADASVYASSALVLRQLAPNAQRNGFTYCGQIG